VSQTVAGHRFEVCMELQKRSIRLGGGKKQRPVHAATEGHKIVDTTRIDSKLAALYLNADSYSQAMLLPPHLYDPSPIPRV